jgi:hypothetical protein
MGETLTFYRQSFQLPPEHEDDALRAVQTAHAKEAFPLAGHGGGKDPLAAAGRLEEGLRVLGLGLRRDGRQYIVGIFCIGDVRPGVEERLFQAIGPYVDEDSFVDLEGHPDEGLVRYRFDGKSSLRRHVRVSERAWTKYLETHEAELEAAEQLAPPEAPSWKQVSRSMPATMPPYDPSTRFPRESWLKHPKFGAGFVVRNDDGKIRVLFETGERTLAARR